MRLRDITMYGVSLFLALPSIFLSPKNDTAAKKELLQDIPEEITDPELTSEGLTRREEVASGPGTGFAFYGLMSMILSTVLMVIFDATIVTYLLNILAAWLIPAGIYMLLFRAFIASMDKSRFEREGKPEDFQLSHRVIVRWYDLLSGVPFAILIAYQPFI